MAKRFLHLKPGRNHFEYYAPGNTVFEDEIGLQEGVDKGTHWCMFLHVPTELRDVPVTSVKLWFLSAAVTTMAISVYITYFNDAAPAPLVYAPFSYSVTIDQGPGSAGVFLGDVDIPLTISAATSHVLIEVARDNSLTEHIWFVMGHTVEVEAD